MNKNAAGTSLVLILAAAGIAYDRPWSLGLTIATCALAFVADELRDFHDGLGRVLFGRAIIATALLSWVTVSAAAFLLVL